MVDYHEKAQQAISNNPELTWAKIKDHTSEILYRLTQQKVSASSRDYSSPHVTLTAPLVFDSQFESPKDGEKAYMEKYDKLSQDIAESFRTLQD